MNVTFIWRTTTFYIRGLENNRHK